jgi:hypothetical protein
MSPPSSGSNKPSKVQAGGKPSNRLAGNFGLYRKQEVNRVDLSFHWLAVGHNETAGLSHDHRANQ